jgi:hypothetical protein
MTSIFIHHDDTSAADKIAIFILGGFDYRQLRVMLIAKASGARPRRRRATAARLS